MEEEYVILYNPIQGITKPAVRNRQEEPRKEVKEDKDETNKEEEDRGEEEEDKEESGPLSKLKKSTKLKEKCQYSNKVQILLVSDRKIKLKVTVIQLKGSKKEPVPIGCKSPNNFQLFAKDILDVYLEVYDKYLRYLYGILGL